MVEINTIMVQMSEQERRELIEHIEASDWVLLFDKVNRLIQASFNAGRNWKE
jgi:hypothetical protein